jgi:hypothetical protein
MLNNLWSYLTIPTPTPFNIWTITTPPLMTCDTPMVTHDPPTASHRNPLPCVQIQIPHHPVFSITHHAREPPLPTPGNPLMNQRPLQRWKFKLNVTLSFQCHLSLPTLPSLTSWRWKACRPPPPIPIIPVTPNYKLMKTLITPPENYLGMDPESRPPSYHIQQYYPSPCNNNNPTSNKSMASSSQPSRPPMLNKYKPFEDPAQYPLLTPLKPIRQMQTKTPTPTMMTTKGASTSGLPRTLSTHSLMVVSTLKWDG